MPPDTREERPAGLDRALQKLDGRQTSSRVEVYQAAVELAASPRTAAEVAARRRWEYWLIRKCPTPPPLYGSPEWLALPNDSAAKVAACVRAAACWARDGDELPERLAAELDAAREAAKRIEDADYRERYRAHRRQCRPPRGKSFTERRAAQLAAVAPRPGDYGGKGAS